METLITQHGPAVLMILWFLFMVATGIASKLFWDKLGHMENRQDAMEKDLQAIKGNYLNRFEIMQQTLAETKDEILEKIHDLHILVLESGKPNTKRR